MASGKILITCTNDADTGGLYLWDLEKNLIERKYPFQCMGADKIDDLIVLASQSTPNEQSFNDRGSVHAPHSIVCLNSEFQIVSEAPVSSLGMGDLHDLHIEEDRIWVVDTLGNRVVVFQISTASRADSLPLGHDMYIHPILEWRDPIAAEPDASHVNGVCTGSGMVLVSVFGRFSIYRGYSERADSGCVLDITNDLRPFGQTSLNSTPRIIHEGLSDPHSLLFDRGHLYLCESRKRRLLKDWQPFFEFESGYLRGLLVQDDILYVGSSQSRHALEDCAGSTKIHMICMKSKQLLASFPVPAKEIYGLTSAQ